VKKFLFTILLFALAAVACQSDSTEITKNAVPEVASTTPKTEPSKPQNKNYDGKGVVTKINLKQSSVELNHEKIEGLMEPMIMEFNVANKADLEKLNVGDKVDFVLEFKDWNEKIISIKKAQ
jgi:Cu/Ag efflux protein CusF